MCEVAANFPFIVENEFPKEYNQHRNSMHCSSASDEVRFTIHGDVSEPYRLWRKIRQCSKRC